MLDSQQPEDKGICKRMPQLPGRLIPAAFHSTGTADDVELLNTDMLIGGPDWHQVLCQPDSSCKLI